MIRAADYIARTLVEHGIRDAFMVTGGGAMHLNDAFGHCEGLQYWPCHHEQACAMAAEAYFRTTGRMALVNVTTGPGGTNAITGVYGAHMDSQAMIVISGQVKWETCVRSTGLPLRQLGDQELDIVPMVAPITKYAVMVTDPATLRYHLERALHLALQGRPGPVWLDIPMNVQGAEVDPAAMKPYDPAEDAWCVPGPGRAREGADLVREALLAAKRPVILGGSGIWTSGTETLFRELAGRLGIPFVTAFNGHDLLPSDHPALTGRQGCIGDRAGNFTVQNSDFLLILGSRMNIRQVGYNWGTFAPGARVAMVDIDEAELKKPTLKVDLPIHADLKPFMEALERDLRDWEPLADHRRWLSWCLDRKAKYPVVHEGLKVKDAPVNPYVFMDALFRALEEGDTIVTGDGTACIAAFQAGIVKTGQRLFSNSGSAPMGFDLPAAVGAAVARAPGRVVALAGDGSIMMNLQELSTLGFHGMNVKVFLLNNEGYHSIRQTQNAYFPGPQVGIGPGSRLGFPDFALVAQAHGLSYFSIVGHGGMEAVLAQALATPGPVLCEVRLDPAQPFEPRVASRRLEGGRMVSASLEDMAPFLSPEELEANTPFIPKTSEPSRRPL